MSHMTNESDDTMRAESESLSAGGSSSGGSKCEGVVLKKGPWTTAEDAILIEYVKKHGQGNWNAVQHRSKLLRCGKSCRLRWVTQLRPDLKKGPFSQEEEQLIIELHSKMGNKWAQMASHLPGRTDNEIKNYWNTRTKRRQRVGLPLYPPEVNAKVVQDDQDHGKGGIARVAKRHHDFLQDESYETYPSLDDLRGTEVLSLALDLPDFSTYDMLTKNGSSLQCDTFEPLFTRSQKRHRGPGALFPGCGTMMKNENPSAENLQDTEVLSLALDLSDLSTYDMLTKSGSSLQCDTFEPLFTRSQKRHRGPGALFPGCGTMVKNENPSAENLQDTEVLSLALDLPDLSTYDMLTKSGSSLQCDTFEPLFTRSQKRHRGPGALFPGCGTMVKNENPSAENLQDTEVLSLALDLPDLSTYDMLTKSGSSLQCDTFEPLFTRFQKRHRGPGALFPGCGTMVKNENPSAENLQDTAPQNISRFSDLSFPIPCDPDLPMESIHSLDAVPGSHALSNGNCPASKSLFEDVKSELPSFQYLETDWERWNSSPPSAPIDSVNVFIRSPSPRDSGLLDMVLLEARTRSGIVEETSPVGKSSDPASLGGIYV